MNDLRGFTFVTFISAPSKPSLNSQSLHFSTHSFIANPQGHDSRLRGNRQLTLKNLPATKSAIGMTSGVLKLALLLRLFTQHGVQATLKCQIDASQEAKATVFGSVDFEFWYAVGLAGKSSELDDIQIFEIEQALYSSIDEEVLWCTSSVESDDPTGQEAIMSIEDSSVEDSLSGEGGLRKRAFLQDSAGGTVLGPVLFTPGRKDEVTDCEWY